MRLTIILAFTLFTYILSAQTALETKLFNLCGVSFEKIETAEGFESSYKLMVRQPIDHNDESKGFFTQKVYLNHLDFDSTTVQVTEGYNRNSNRIYELTTFVHANQATVEHRFFGESKPDSLEYQYLNFAQATADHHNINQLLRQIYNGKFIATGISKGGTTTIFYKYFYPNDVSVSVPYVAPLNRDLEEKRIYHFLDTVGSEDCKKSILAFQKRVLTNRAYSLERLKWFVKGKGLKFNYLTLEEAFEYAVLEYPFSLWQWGTDCKNVPQQNSTLENDLDHLLEVSGVEFFADASMSNYASHYYQSGTEMGYYGYEAKPFKGLLKALGEDKNPSAVFAPNKMDLEWDGKLTNAVADWIENEGNYFIYINGLNDTWSATRVPVSNKVNSVWFDLQGQSHGTARIANMSEDQKSKLRITLNNWLY